MNNAFTNRHEIKALISADKLHQLRQEAATHRSLTAQQHTSSPFSPFSPFLKALSSLRFPRMARAA